MRLLFTRHFAPIMAVVALSVPLLSVGPATAHPGPTNPDRVVGHVYEATNDPVGNAIQVFDRRADGQIAAAGLVPTGGLGLGRSLASQYALVRDGRLLLVVNGGDDTVSAFTITSAGPVLRDVESTGGDLPVSVTVHNGIVYVLNQGSETISGLRVGSSGKLRPLPDTTRSLSRDAARTPTAAAQVSFTPNGKSLVVTHKGDQAIDTFAVAGPHVGQAVRNDSSGLTPYGFDFDRRGHVIVSEAGSGAVSSYRVRGGALHVISASVPDTQNAACWLVVTRDGRFAYTVNAASSSISSYRIGHDGSLALLAAVAASTTGGGTDAALSPDSHSLFVRLSDGSVSSYTVAKDGSLTFADSATGAATSGIAGLTTD